jgi:uncharacterized protein (DUF427 family)
MAGKSPGFAKRPDYRVDFIPSPRRVRVEFGGEIIADSTRVMMARETGHTPVYYFPMADVRTDLMAPTDHGTHCPYKGDASYWTIKAGGKDAENAMWSYRDPYDESAAMKDYCAFYWGRMDHWYDEDEEIFVHPRDPYKRIDVVASKRPVRVVLGGETVAETTNARFLFETGLPVRYYIPADDVRLDLLEPSDSRTSCPYKGTASYYSARIGGKLFEDVVWVYPDPVPECPKIEGLLCFYNEVVDDIMVDGAAIPKVRTQWSRA